MLEENKSFLEQVRFGQLLLSEINQDPAPDAGVLGFENLLPNLLWSNQQPTFVSEGLTLDDLSPDKNLLLYNQHLAFISSSGDCLSSDDDDSAQEESEDFLEHFIARKPAIRWQVRL